TRIVRAHEHAKPQLFSWDGDVLIVNIGPYADSVTDDGELLAARNALAPELAKAMRVIIDLRTESAETPAWLLDETALVDQTIAVPAQRYVFRSGYPSQQESKSGGFYSALQVVASSPISAAPKSTHVQSRIVLITREDLPPNAAALWWSGKAAIVSTRPGSGPDVGETKRIDLGNGSTVFVRVSEAVATGLTPDAAGDDPSAMSKAIALARDPAPLPPRPAPRVTASVPVAQKESPYAEMSAPDASYRLLALFRLWSVIDRFYPYKDLIDDWDAVLREFIPRFEAAEGADNYARTVMELAARIEDGHTQVFGPPAVWDVIGPRLLPLEVRPIEGRFIVTAKRKALPADADIAVGDEVVSVDGEPLSDRVKRLWKYFTASTETARLASVLGHALRGARNSVAELVVRGADGKLRTVKIARTQFSPIVDERLVWRVIDHDIGYIDLTRLTADQIDAAFDAVKETKALIFDMRGYPNGTGWSIAARINRKNATVSALFSRPEISVTTSDQSNTRYAFEQRFATTDKPRYTGRTVMLIDDRAISQAEHTGLWFEAASGTKFIG
ncbi:MAG TPA: PDZ domain-containing protein, partial [Thermoanaerobaculia bacterium]